MYVCMKYSKICSIYLQIDFGDAGDTIDFSSADIELAEDLTTGDIDWGNLSTEEPQTIDWGADGVHNIREI